MPVPHTTVSPATISPVYAAVVANTVQSTWSSSTSTCATRYAGELGGIVFISAGTVPVTFHGPVAALATNHTRSNLMYSTDPSLSTSLSVFTARAIGVPAIRRKTGGPSYATAGAFSFLLTRTEYRARATRAASAACGVPGTDANTRDRGWSSGIFVKSSGSRRVANVHGPVKSGAANQRPDTR